MITEWLNSVFDLFSSLYDFVIGIFEDIVYVIRLTAHFVAKIPDYFDWLPPEALVLVVGIFAIVVIYKVLGREG